MSENAKPFQSAKISDPQILQNVTSQDTLVPNISTSHLLDEEVFLDTSKTAKNEKFFTEETHELKKTPDFIADDGIDYPEGGFKAWLVIFGCFCGLTPTFGIINAMGIIETHIQSNQLASVSSSTIGWVFSLFLFINFGSCIFSGTYFDRNGSTLPLIIGTCFQVGGLFGMANATKLWHFLLSFSILCGLGNGTLMSPLASVPSHYFMRKRGTATAIATAGGSIGGIVYPVLLRKMFGLKSHTSENYGFIWGIRTMAFMNLGLLIISILLAKERLPHIEDKESDKQNPKWKRVLNTYVLECFHLKSFTEMNYLFCVLGTLFGEVSITSAMTYYGSYATSKGVSSSDAYLLIMVINIAGIPGRWLPGIFSDIFGRFNVAITTLLFLTFITLVAWLPFGNTLGNLYGVSVLYGFSSGSVFSLLPVCCGQISKTEEFGRRYSTMYFVVAFGTLVGAPITGAIIGPDKTHSGYQNYVIWCAMTSLASAICFIISRYFCVGMKAVKF